MNSDLYLVNKDSGWIVAKIVEGEEMEHVAGPYRTQGAAELVRKQLIYPRSFDEMAANVWKEKE